MLFLPPSQQCQSTEGHDGAVHYSDISELEVTVRRRVFRFMKLVDSVLSLLTPRWEHSQASFISLKVTPECIVEC